MKTLKALFYLIAICVMLVFLWPLLNRGGAGFMAGFEHGLNPTAPSTTTSPARPTPRK